MELVHHKIWKRKCGNCGKELIYKNVNSFRLACQKNNNCYSCAAKNRPKRNKEFYEKISFNKTSKENRQILLNHLNLEKKCPNCKKVIKYKNKISLIRSVKNNTWCNSCIQKRDILSGKRKSWNKGKKLGKNFRDKIKKSWENTKIKRSGIYHPFFGKPGPMTGKHHSEKTKEKQRISHLSYIKRKYGNKKFIPNYNKNFCKWLNQISKKHNIKIIHAENEGEFEIKGYFADGYVPNVNLWIEYDEPKHFFGGKLRKDEILRQSEITRYLKCKFLRIKDNISFENFEKILLHNI